MPSQRQMTMIDTIVPTTSKKGRSDTARLKKAFGSHPNSVVKPTPATSLETGAGAEQVFVTLHRESYRHAYENLVKSGEKHIPGSYFPEAGEKGASMDYSGAPEIGQGTPEGEKAPGQNGSTIIESGLGPNVNVTPVEDITTREMVDVTSKGTPVLLDGAQDAHGKLSPHETSGRIANESSLPPGSLGESTTGGVF